MAHRPRQVRRNKAHRKVAGRKQATGKQATGTKSAFRIWQVAATGVLLAGAMVGLIAYLTPLAEPDPVLTIDGPGQGSSLGQPIHETPPSVDDPTADGWVTEAFHLAVQRQLGPLKAYLLGNLDQDVDLQATFSEQFACQPLRPASLREVYRDKTFTVRRSIGQPQLSTKIPAPIPTAMSTGLAGWKESCHDLLEVLAGTTNRHVGLKIFALQQQPHQTLGRALLELSGQNAGQHVQIKATWQIRWPAGQAGAEPVIGSIGVEDYEETIAHCPEGPLFVDRTARAFADQAVYRDQFLVGLDRWMEQIPTFSGPVRWGDQGAALGDANGDGLDDLYLCEPACLPNRLFLRQLDGTLREVSAASGVDWLDHSRSALFIDLDNDGDQDLAVSLQAALVLAENDGQGKFTPRVRWRAMPDAHSLAAADYDQDGRLDLFACGYHSQDDKPEVYPLPIPYHNATNGGANLLLHNEGAWKFRDATEQTGLGQENYRWSLAASWEDYDNDGDVDLYIANDFGRNQLFQNEGGTFTNVAAQAGVEDVGSGMSVAWGDSNHDGWMDLYVSNMFSTAGGRITSQAQFRSAHKPSERRQYRQMAAGNSLFQNQTDGTFRNIAPAAAVGRARWAWGASFTDLNNDTWDDLVVTNGFITRKDLRDL